MIREALDRMERLDLLRVAKALQSSSAALVIGPPERGMTGMDLTRLLPPPTAASGADAGRNAEELIATALASLTQPSRPILVFIHGQPGHGLLRSPDFAGLMDRISMRGMDVAEWAAAVDAEQPVLSRLDPSGKRPVVYVVLSTDTSVNPGGKGMSGPDRAAKLGKIISDLIEGGETVLLSLNPSTLPTFGQLDPMTAPLAGFGIKADTGRPILAERFTAGGRFVDAAQTLTAPDGQSPVANAIRGLPARLEWPIAVNATSADGVRTWPLLVVDNKSAWAESQWLNYWQVRIADHELVPDKPSRDSERDDVKGPWTVALAAERGPPSDAQRLIVVGSNSWFMDRVALEQSVIDGRAAPAYPGNIELFEAAVYWLAGQDAMIAPAQPPGGSAYPSAEWWHTAGDPVADHRGPAGGGADGRDGVAAAPRLRSRSRIEASGWKRTPHSGPHRILGDSVQVIPALDTVALGDPRWKARDEHGDADDQHRVRVQHRLKNPKVDAAVRPDVEPPMEVRDEGQACGAEQHIGGKPIQVQAACTGVTHGDGVSGKEYRRGKR